MNTVTLQTEMKKRTDYIESESFRIETAKLCEQMGMTAEEWNKNKIKYLLYFANMCCKFENENGLNNN